jgi:hypothetical protein
MPTAIAPVIGRVMSSVRIAILKPSPSSPSRCPTGTAQSVKWSATVGEQRMPIFFSFLPTEKPGVPLSMRNAVMPRARLPGSTVVKTVSTSAWSPWEHHCLDPFRM